MYSFAAALLVEIAGCAQIKRPAVQVKGGCGRFALSINPGGFRCMPVSRCAPQIMFDFHGTRSMVSLAAPRRETEILTEAANKQQRVHILGKWRRGAQSQCSYVEVTSAE